MAIKDSLYRLFQSETLLEVENEVKKILSRPIEDDRGNPITFDEAFAKKWSNILSFFSIRFGRLSTGNLVHVFQDGNEAITDMLKAINGAKKRVWIEVYIFDDSNVAELFANALKDASKRGCNVIVLADYAGCFWTSNNLLMSLESSGVNFCYFNSLYDSMSPFFFRNHKKLLVVDDDCVYCGSLNISNNGVDDRFKGTSQMYDIHAKVNGPIVYDLAESFVKSLKMTGYRGPILTLNTRPKPYEDGSIAQVFESNMPKHRKDIQSSIITALSKADRSVYLSTSYFIPPGSLRRALVTAKQRNLKFELLLSGKSDVICDENATFHVLRKFFKRNFTQLPNNNFKVFMTNNIHFHGKAITVDDVWSSLGSFNWDRLSGRRNMEINLGVFDPRVSKALRDIQLRKIEESREYTRGDFISRPKLLKIVDFLCYYIVKFTGSNTFDGLSNDGYKLTFKKTFTRTFIEKNISNLMILSSLPGV